MLETQSEPEDQQIRESDDIDRMLRTALGDLNYLFKLYDRLRC